MKNDENTQSINLNDPAFLQMLEEADDEGETVPTLTFQEIILRVGDARITLNIDDHQTYFLGRFRGNESNEVDLNPHGALQYGISRLHAQIDIDGYKIYLTDLNSSNGTYIGKKRLKPNQATRLRNGDVMLLGRLKMLVTLR